MNTNTYLILSIWNLENMSRTESQWAAWAYAAFALFFMIGFAYSIKPNKRLKIETRLNGTWETVASGLRSNKSLTFPTTAASSYSDLTITVTGAATGDVCSVGVPLAAQVANTSCTCFVSAADTVTVRFTNNDPSLSAGPAPGIFKIFVIK